jgi:hypothetical protein
MKKLFYQATLLLAMSACMYGCSSKNANDEDITASKLPAGAKNIVSVGNGWVTFDCDIGGRNRRFLAKENNTYGRYPVMSLAELQDDAPKPESEKKKS